MPDVPPRGPWRDAASRQDPPAATRWEPDGDASSPFAQVDDAPTLLGLPAAPSGRIPPWVLEEAERARATGTKPNFGPFGEPPPGGPPGYWGTPAGNVYSLPGAPEPRRRSLAARLATIAVVLAIGLAAVFVVADRVRTTHVPPELLGSYAERDDLPSPLSLNPAAQSPTPGFGEQSRPLGVPPAVTEESDSWTYQRTDDRDRPVLWSPCRPIHYVINTDRAPEDFVVKVAEAVEDVSAATGLQFAYDGTTTEAVSPEREPFLPRLYGDRWAPVLIGWADAEQHSGLAGNVAGLAHVVSYPDRAMGRQHIVSGQVILDVAMPRTWLDSDWYLGTLRHELAHLAGLGHTDDPSQNLHPSSSVDSYQAGDLTGLAAVGAGPCTSRL